MTTKEYAVAGQFSRLQELEKTLKQLQGHLAVLGSQIDDLESSMTSIEGVESSDDGAQVLLRVADGVFVPAMIVDRSKVFVSVGAKIVVEKSSSQMRGHLAEQLRHTREARESVQAQAHTFFLEFQRVQEQLRSHV